MRPMKQSSEPTAARIYRKQFWQLAAKSLPYQYLLYLSLKTKIAPITQILNKRRQRELSEAHLQSYPANVQAQYLDGISQTKLWHGSGRLQHDNGGITDIFDTILRGGSLNPLKDDYAIMLGGRPMNTISTTPLRMIARCYADMHGKGKFEPNRYGSSVFWVAYFYGRFFATVYTTKGLTLLKNRAKFENATKNTSGQRIWGKKVHLQAEYVWDVFSSGSDISGNYPILYGIKTYRDVAKLAGALSRAEVRLTSPVYLADLSHLEVPNTKIDEVKARLVDYNCALPVFPIELGEYVASHQDFNVLVGLH